MNKSILVAAIVIVTASMANGTVIDVVLDGVGNYGHAGTVGDPLIVGETIKIKLVLNPDPGSYCSGTYPSYDGYVLSAMDLTLTADADGTMDVIRIEGQPQWGKNSDWTFKGNSTIVSNVLDTGPYASLAATAGTTRGIDTWNGSAQVVTDLLWNITITASGTGNGQISLTWGLNNPPGQYYDYVGNLSCDPGPANDIVLGNLGGLTIYVQVGPSWSYPDCWNYSTQCHADTDDSGDVGLLDFYDFRDSWNKSYPHASYIPCADTNRDGNVGLLDFYDFRDNWNQSVTGDCPLGDVNRIFEP